MKFFNLFLFFYFILFNQTETFSQTNNQLITVNNVSNFTDLNAISSPYKGNIAYVIEDSTIYQFDGLDWINFCREQRPTPFYLGQDTLDGIVTYIYFDENDEQHGFVVSKRESSRSWQSSPTNVTTNHINGEQNSSNMINSPSINWINNTLGNGWYLPSPNEIHKIFQNLLHVNPAMVSTSSDIVEGEYWSSHQINNNSALGINLSTGEVAFGTKIYPKKVRAIKKF